MANEEIARFYTRGRRFPKLIGRMTDGSRIPGGPYTMTQVLAGGGMFLVAMMFRNVWTTNALLLDLGITAGLSYGTVWIVGLIPLTRRNPVAAVMSGVAAMFKPVEGRYQGAVPRIRAPHHVGGTALVLTLDPETYGGVPLELAPAPEQAAAPTAAPQPFRAVAESAPIARVPMSAVERLLQQAQSTKEKI